MSDLAAWEASAFVRAFIGRTRMPSLIWADCNKEPIRQYMARNP